MLQNYTKTGVVSKTQCTFREFVRARLDIRPFQFTSTMTSATVTATDTFNDAVKYVLQWESWQSWNGAARTRYYSNAGCAVWHHIAVISRTSSARRKHRMDSCTDGRRACSSSFSFVPFAQLKKECIQSIVLSLHRASS